MPDPVTILRGLPPEHEKAAAELFWESFGGKLGKLMGPDARGIGFFAATINPDRVIAAVDSEGVLLGIAAYKMHGQGFSAGGLRDLFRHYGIGAFWRALPLAMLERDAPKDSLQMDGICVAAKARGRGVGSALLAELFSFAAKQGFAKITLDVIDTNPRARALYQRLGFQAVSIENTGPFRHLLGFRQATKMHRSV